MTSHEQGIIEYGECAACGSSNPDEICAEPCGECSECGCFIPGPNAGNVCTPCMRELGGEA